MSFEEIVPGMYLGEGTYQVTREAIARFARLLNYDDPIYFDEDHARRTSYGGIITPPGMLFIYGLKLGWELKLYPPGAIRMGDDNTYYTPAHPGDVLTTTITVSERFERKQRKFLKIKLETTNQRQEPVCTVDFTTIIP
jgi:acyl dehydratase